MNKRQRNAAVKAFAAEVARSLEKSTNVGISAFNYGLRPDAKLAEELRVLLPGIVVGDFHGFMGYMYFNKQDAR
jgi:hypothetical protein